MSVPLESYIKCFEVLSRAGIAPGYPRVYQYGRRRMV